jgi:ubiquinone/menaquinone biosynthesis C-methylase UbiE
MLFLNYSTLIDPLLRGLRQFMVAFSGFKFGDRVLDVCCGTGDQTFYYARAGLIAYGIDLAPNMLRLARRDRRRWGQDNIAFQLADARHLPFRDSSFDGASISFALHEKDGVSRHRVITEMKRVVKKEGTLLFADFQVPMPGNVWTYIARTAEFLAGREHHRCFRDYVSSGGLDEMLSKSGLCNGRRVNSSNGLITTVKISNP